ncbi:MAG: hypothetical protein C0622_03195 [Desulfuromonas sp.]|nr:MAG: hypothetical protein C0622_03195 [Desulfuromonas sp.]
MILYYDGSLDGFICLLGHAVKEHLPVTAILSSKKPASVALFEQERIIVTDPDWAATVAGGLHKKLGQRFMRELAQAYYSEEKEIEHDLLHLVRRALKSGPGVLGNLADPLINRVASAAQKTGRESHRLLGLLRFRRLIDDSYLACCAPRTNAAPLTGSHFAARFQAMRWVILDEKRQLGIFGTTDGWQLCTDVAIAPELLQHAEENEIATLWRNFYHNISNPDRFNPKLRRQFMPKKEWRYLTEMQPEGASASPSESESESESPSPSMISKQNESR